MAALERLLQRPQQIGAGQQWAEPVGAARAGLRRGSLAGPCLHHQPVPAAQAALHQGPGAEPGRRVEQHHAAAFIAAGRPAAVAAASGHAARRGIGRARGQRRQGRGQQAQLAHAGLGQQQLGQRAMRPAAAGQLGIQGREAAGGGALRRAADLAGPPQRGVQLGQAGGARHRVQRGLIDRAGQRVGGGGCGGICGAICARLRGAVCRSIGPAARSPGGWVDARWRQQIGLGPHRRAGRSQALPTRQASPRQSRPGVSRQVKKGQRQVHRDTVRLYSLTGKHPGKGCRA